MLFNIYEWIVGCPPEDLADIVLLFGLVSPILIVTNGAALFGLGTLVSLFIEAHIK